MQKKFRGFSHECLGRLTEIAGARMFQLFRNLGKLETSMFQGFRDLGKVKTSAFQRFRNVGKVETCVFQYFRNVGRVETSMFLLFGAKKALKSFRPQTFAVHRSTSPWMI